MSMAVPPRRLIIDNTIAYRGKTVTIHCPVVSYPAAEIKWIRPKYKLVNTNGFIVNNNLSIVDVKQKDEGVYLCQARNKFGSTFTAVGVEVRDAGMLVEKYSRNGSCTLEVWSAQDDTTNNYYSQPLQQQQQQQQQRKQQQNDNKNNSNNNNSSNKTI